ncbi:MAG: hypothetical protein Q4G46_15905 [Propionibacteriaceae bacterium]|nr:hypothetical protein [Propionibacteriaceae bacterium]
MSYSTPMMSVIPVRPLSIGDLFQSAFAIYRNRFATFLLLGAIPSIVSLVVMLAGVALMVGGLLPLVISLVQGNPTTAGLSVAAVAGGGAVLVLGSFLTAISTYICNALIAVGVVDVDRGLAPSLGDLWRQSRGLAGRSFSLYLLVIAATLGLALVLIVLGAIFVALEIYWLIALLVLAIIPIWVIAQARLGLVLQVIAIEQVDAIGAIKRCWRLTQGSGARIFGLLVLAQMLVGVATQTIGGITQSLAGTFSDQLASANPDPFVIATLLVPMLLLGIVVTQALGVLAGPFVAIYTAVLYIDQRRRKEAAAGLPIFQ